MPTTYKRILGVLALIVGFIALITPFTPGAFWLIFVGLELLGIHFLFSDRIFKKISEVTGMQFFKQHPLEKEIPPPHLPENKKADDELKPPG